MKSRNKVQMSSNKARGCEMNLITLLELPLLLERNSEWMLEFVMMVMVSTISFFFFVRKAEEVEARAAGNG